MWLVLCGNSDAVESGSWRREADLRVFWEAAFAVRP